MREFLEKLKSWLKNPTGSYETLRNWFGKWIAGPIDYVATIINNIISFFYMAKDKEQPEVVKNLNLQIDSGLIYIIGGIVFFLYQSYKKFKQKKQDSNIILGVFKHKPFQEWLQKNQPEKSAKFLTEIDTEALALFLRYRPSNQDYEFIKRKKWREWEKECRKLGLKKTKTQLEEQLKDISQLVIEFLKINYPELCIATDGSFDLTDEAKRNLKEKNAKQNKSEPEPKSKSFLIKFFAECIKNLDQDSFHYWIYTALFTGVIGICCIAPPLIGLGAFLGWLVLVGGMGVYRKFFESAESKKKRLTKKAEQELQQQTEEHIGTIKRLILQEINLNNIHVEFNTLLKDKIKQLKELEEKKALIDENIREIEQIKELIKNQRLDFEIFPELNNELNNGYKLSYRLIESIKLIEREIDELNRHKREINESISKENQRWIEETLEQSERYLFVYAVLEDFPLGLFKMAFIISFLLAVLSCAVAPPPIVFITILVLVNPVILSIIYGIHTGIKGYKKRSKDQEQRENDCDHYLKGYKKYGTKIDHSNRLDELKSLFAVLERLVEKDEFDFSFEEAFETPLKDNTKTKKFNITEPFLFIADTGTGMLIPKLTGLIIGVAISVAMGLSSTPAGFVLIGMFIISGVLYAGWRRFWKKRIDIRNAKLDRLIADKKNQTALINIQIDNSLEDIDSLIKNTNVSEEIKEHLEKIIKEIMTLRTQCLNISDLKLIEWGLKQIDKYLSSNSAENHPIPGLSLDQENQPGTYLGASGTKVGFFPTNSRNTNSKPTNFGYGLSHTFRPY